MRRWSWCRRRHSCTLPPRLSMAAHWQPGFDGGEDLVPWKNKAPGCARVGGKEHGGCGLRLQFSLLSKAAMDPSSPRNGQFCQDIISNTEYSVHPNWCI